MQPKASQPVKAKDYVIINGMYFNHSEILEWREQQCAQRDQHSDDRAIDVFAQAMKNKMAQCRENGRTGWDSKVLCSDEYLAKLLIHSVGKGDPVDIANFAMMLFSRTAKDETLKLEMVEYLCMYQSVIDKAQRKFKDAAGIVEVPRMLLDIYIDMQHNASRYTVDRRVATEEQLLKLIEIKDEPVSGEKVTSEF